MERHASASYATLLPADVRAARLVEAHLGQHLPPLLRAWWALVPGTSRTHAGAILPGGHRLLPASDSVRLPQSWWDIERSSGDQPDALRTGDDEPAGSISLSWLPTFLPLAEDFSGNCLFFDLRQGERRGCVQHYDHEEGGLDPPRWSSAVDLMEDVAAALEQDARCGLWLPTVTDDMELSWILDV